MFRQIKRDNNFFLNLSSSSGSIYNIRNTKWITITKWNMTAYNCDICYVSKHACIETDDHRFSRHYSYLCLELNFESERKCSVNEASIVVSVFFVAWTFRVSAVVRIGLASCLFTDFLRLYQLYGCWSCAVFHSSTEITVLTCHST